MAGPSPDLDRDRLEAQRARDLRKYRPASFGMPMSMPTAANAGEAAGDDSDEGSARAELERGQFAARQASVAAGLGVLALASGAAAAETQFASRPKMSKDEEQLWKGIYKAVDGTVNSFFFASFWTILLALFAAPIIVLYYLIRLARANLLNDGKPVKFPIFGIVSGWLMPLEFPLGILNAMTWIFLSIFAFGLALVAILVVLYTASQLCGTFSSICGIAGLGK